MALTRKTFASNLMLIAENFCLTISQKYSELIFNILKSADVTDEEFRHVINEIILTKTKSEFPVLPSAASWLEILKKKNKSLSLKEMAILQCASAIEEAKRARLGEEAITFQNKITNAVIENFGGLASIQKRVLNESWDKNESFFRREFEETWSSFSKVGKTSEAIFGIEKKEICQFQTYSVIRGGVERFGSEKIISGFIENPKRIIPDLLQNQITSHQILSTNKALIT